jgi:hypothetical protein
VKNIKWTNGVGDMEVKCSCMFVWLLGGLVYVSLTDDDDGRSVESTETDSC